MNCAAFSALDLGVLEVIILSRPFPGSVVTDVL
jgi:hypothetical protein